MVVKEQEKPIPFFRVGCMCTLVRWGSSVANRLLGVSVRREKDLLRSSSDAKWTRRLLNSPSACLSPVVPLSQAPVDPQPGVCHRPGFFPSFLADLWLAPFLEVA